VILQIYFFDFRDKHRLKWFNLHPHPSLDDDEIFSCCEESRVAKNKAANAGVDALTGFEFQRNCALYLLLDNSILLSIKSSLFVSNITMIFYFVIKLIA
jgi:hypothetical protein